MGRTDELTDGRTDNPATICYPETFWGAKNHEHFCNTYLNNNLKTT